MIALLASIVIPVALVAIVSAAIDRQEHEVWLRGRKA